MGIKIITPPENMNRHLQEQLARKGGMLHQILSYTGEVGVKTARDQGTYQNRTGNLRSSIGYGIVNNGKRLSLGKFTSINGLRGPDSGVGKSKELIEKILGNFPKGMVLVQGAGMDYAGYVSAMGYNVLESARAVSISHFEGLLKTHQFNLK